MFEELSGFRHEHKYVEPEINLLAAQMRLATFMKKDPHVTDKGWYGIRSLYFDDHHDRYLQENIDGVDERMKWRIRIYDRNSGHISLERKIRKSDLIRKQTYVIDRAVFDAIMADDVQISDSNPPLLNMFITDMRTGALHPRIIVEYERTPFVCREGNTRVTIDRNIRSSSEIREFLSDKELSSRPVLLSGQNLIEVKYDAFLPDHIAHAIEHGRMRRETFSKYSLARRFSYNGLGRQI